MNKETNESKLSEAPPIWKGVNRRPYVDQNIAQLLLSLQKEDELSLGTPATLMIEPTNVCDLACPLCPTGAGTLTRRKGFMPFDSFRKVVDDLLPELQNVVMWNYGEPYLNKQLGKMFAYAREVGLHTSCSTNGFLLHHDFPLGIEQILSNPPDHLIVSIDGASKASHEWYRVGSSFEQLLRGLQKLCQSKKEYGTKFLLEAQFVVMAHNEHEIDAFVKMVSEAGVDSYTLKTVNVSMLETPISLSEAAASHIRISSRKSYLPKTEALRRYSTNMAPKNVPPKGCSRPWEMIVVNHDGQVSPCCYDADAKLDLGNAFQTSAKEIWNSEPYRDLRRRLKLSRLLVPLCSVCTDSSPTLLKRELFQPKKNSGANHV